MHLFLALRVTAGTKTNKTMVGETRKHYTKCDIAKVKTMLDLGMKCTEIVNLGKSPSATPEKLRRRRWGKGEAVR